MVTITPIENLEAAVSVRAKLNALIESVNLLSTPAINSQVGTSYTLDADDNTQVVTLNNASAVTLNVPSGLGSDFACMIIQLGAGQVNVVAGVGVTINSLFGATHLAGRYAVGNLFAISANSFILAGAIA